MNKLKYILSAKWAELLKDSEKNKCTTEYMTRSSEEESPDEKIQEDEEGRT